MMVYLCSPYSHKSPHIMKYREELVSKIAAVLTAVHRVTLFLPITQSARMTELKPNLFGTSFAAWQDIDLDAIDHSDEVWVTTIPGWKKSIGVQAEIEHAKKTNKPIRYINYKTCNFQRGKK